MYDYNKDEIKNNLTIEQVFNFINELGGNPQMLNDSSFCSITICHGGDSNKLYYYDNGNEGIFHCYIEGESFDIFQLVQKVFKVRENIEKPLPWAVNYVARFFGISPDFTAEEQSSIQDYLQSLQKYDIIKEKQNKEEKIVELKKYNGDFLKNLPQPIITPWLKDGISVEVMKKYEIHYEPKNQCIVIPHRDIDGNLIGVRQRTLIKEDEVFGKYIPLKIQGQMYNHALGFSLYGLNNTKDNIRRMKHAILVESEKGVMQYESYFGAENNITAAVCGSSITQYQMDLLLSLGVTDVTVAFDKCGSDEPEEIKKYVKKFYNFHTKFGNMVHIDFVYDKDGDYLDLKQSPLDCGKEVFIELYKNRISLY